MADILITTDFSGASRHALDYACVLLHGKALRMQLLHVFSVPINYTADGLALAAIGDAIESAQKDLEHEMQRVKAAWPDIQMEGRVLTGAFLPVLREQTRLQKPLFVILGTAGIAELFPGDADPLNVLSVLRAPVLFVPQGSELKPIRSMVYACNYAYAGPQIPIQRISYLASYLEADLKVLHTDEHGEGEDPEQVAGQQWLQAQLAPLRPTFHWQQDPEVLHGIATFLNGHESDCLLVVPRRHGIWENLFHQSRTKALARMNKFPVLAIAPLDANGTEAATG